MNTPRHFVPNKFVIVFFSLITIAAFAYGFYSYMSSNKKPVQEQKLSQVSVNFIDDSKEDVDSDGDGLPDWLENLYPELDPQNPDSDGDGVLDDRYLEKINNINEKKGKQTEGRLLTQSEKLGQGLFTALMVVEQKKGELDDKTKNKISENVADYIKSLSLGTKEYIRNELNLVPDSKQNSFAYRDAMLIFYKKYPVNTSDIGLIIKASRNAYAYKDEIAEAALRYDEAIQELSVMKVPYTIAGKHTELLNTLGQIEGALKNLSLEEDTDDVVTMAFLVQFDKTLERLISTNLHIEKYFEIISQKGVFDEVRSS